MADPKYADLPGIAYDQPDVYETTDLPEVDQSIDFYEEENESIEKINISAPEAYNKFKGKYLNASTVDFSERVSRKHRTGYQARSGEWEIVGEGEKETPTQKFHRLQCEMNELLEEFNELKAKVKPEDQAQAVILENQTEQVKKMLSELTSESTLQTDVLASLSDPQGTELKRLFNLLDQFKQSGSSSPTKPELKQTGSNAAKDVITYKLEYRPEQAKLLHSTRLSELEQRLHRLATTLGTDSDKLTRLSAVTNENTVLEAVQYLTAKCSALDSAQLDHIEGRLIALTQKMNTLQQQRTATELDAELEQQINDLNNILKKNKSKSANTEDAEILQMVSDMTETVKKMREISVPVDVEKTQKINDLYNFVKNIDSMADLLPQTIKRLAALQSFHQNAVEFNNSLTQLDSLQAEISSGVQNNKALLQLMQEKFAINLENINKNIESLNKRVETLKATKK